MKRYVWLTLTLLAVLGILASCGGSSSDSVDGDESVGGFGEPCYPNGACNDDLTCIGDVCKYPVDNDGDLDDEPISEPEAETECNDNDECPPGYICDGGRCITDPDGDEEEELEAVEAEVEAEVEIDPQGPRLDVSPMPVDFGSVAVDASSVRSLSFRNIGLERLDVMGLEVLPSDTPHGVFEFTAAVDTPFHLQPGETVSAGMRYTRSEAGDDSALLTILSNDAFAQTQTVRLVSNDRGPVALTIDPGMLEFGLVPVGQMSDPLVLTVTNAAEGDDAGTLVIGGVEIEGGGGVFLAGSGMPVFPVELAAGESAYLPVVALPTEVEEVAGTLKILHNDPAQDYPLEVALHTVGTAPDLLLSPTSAEFGPVAVSETNVLTLTLRNVGGMPVSIQSAELTPTSSVAFSVELDPDGDGTDNLPTTLELGGSTTIDLVFSPESIGLHEGILYVVADSLSGEPYTLALSGTGMPPELNITPAELDFGCVAVGQSEERSLSIVYQGAGSVVISDAYIAQSYVFSIATAPEFPVTLNQGDTLDIVAAYEPYEELATQEAQLTIAIGEGDEAITYQVPLVGCGIVARIQLDFDEDNAFLDVQKLPKPAGDMTDEEKALWVAREPAMLTNNGSAPLTVSSILPDAASADTWSTTAEPPFVIQPGESSSFEVLWSPTDPGSDLGRIWICSDAVDALEDPSQCAEDGHAPISIALIRTPIDPRLDVTPNSYDFEQLGPGETADQIFYIRNLRISPMLVESIDIVGSEDFSITDITPVAGEDGWPLTGLSGENIVVTVRFAPQSGDTQAAALVVRHDDKDADRTGGSSGADYPEFSVPLSGNGGVNNPPLGLIKAPPGEPEGQVGRRTITVAIDEILTLDGGDSYDPDSGDHVTGYAWSVDQSEGFVWLGALNTAVTLLRFNTAGRYTVRLDVRDTYGAHNVPSIDSKLEVAVQGDPVAVAVESGSGLSDNITAQLRTPLLLDGTNSYDPDGEIAVYRWFVRSDDQRGEDVLFSNDPQPSYSFEAAGDYVISLEVEDNDGRVCLERDEMHVRVQANDSIRVEMTWTGGGNVDLHWVRPGGSMNGQGDCHEGNPTPDWSTSPGFGHPEFVQASDSGAQPEVFEHLDPGDGVYKLTAEFVSHLEECHNEQICNDYYGNCDLCGCTCPPFCWALRICCDDCRICESHPVCTPRPADLTFRIYLNGSPEPTRTLTGDSYSIPQAPNVVAYSLERRNGAFLLP